MKQFGYKDKDAIYTEATNVCGCKVLIRIQLTGRGTEVETKLKYCPKHEAVDALYEGLNALLTGFVGDDLPEGEIKEIDLAREAIELADRDSV